MYGKPIYANASTGVLKFMVAIFYCKTKLSRMWREI